MTATVEQIEEAQRLIESTYRADRSLPRLTLDERRVLDSVLPAILAQHRAEQVAALGVGDGEVEWGVRLPSGRITRHPDEDSARDQAAGLREDYGIDRALRRRTVGPWVEVTDEGGAGAPALTASPPGVGRERLRVLEAHRLHGGRARRHRRAGPLVDHATATVTTLTMPTAPGWRRRVVDVARAAGVPVSWERRGRWVTVDLGCGVSTTHRGCDGDDTPDDEAGSCRGAIG